MEAASTKNKCFAQPKPLSELLPGLSGILSKDAMHTLTAKKQPRKTLQTRTTEKVVRALTMAEMKADILALKPHSPRRLAQPINSARKRGWNSSVKVDYKKISHTADDKMKDNPVRKVLNFQQPKPKTTVPPRMTIHNTETPKFPKPEFRGKKSLYLQAKNTVRISGICNIAQTPIEFNKPVKNRMTLANKENQSYPANINKNVLVQSTPLISKKTKTPKMELPTPIINQKAKTPKIYTPMCNSSWKSGSDASFLEKEKEICEIEEKIKAIAEEVTLEKLAEVSPPVSTPFKEYRSVQEYFNNSSEIVDSSAVYNDNTIMCFDKPSLSKESENREESVIVSLCDLFNKATVTGTEKENTELDNLLEVKRQTEHNIKMIESGIRMLTNIKESQIKSLQNVIKLIDEKKNAQKHPECDKDKTLVGDAKDVAMANGEVTPEKSPIVSRPCSVIKHSRSPSYRIPKKNTCLRKKVFCKSMPNVSSEMLTPVKDFEGRALNIYMKMKEQMNFLSTPSVNREIQVPDTPAVTSHNLQKQLDKLYNKS